MNCPLSQKRNVILGVVDLFLNEHARTGRDMMSGEMMADLSKGNWIHGCGLVVRASIGEILKPSRTRSEN